jgi:hypothetical protein
MVNDREEMVFKEWLVEVKVAWGNITIMKQGMNKWFRLDL